MLLYLVNIVDDDINGPQNQDGDQNFIKDGDNIMLLDVMCLNVTNLPINFMFESHIWSNNYYFLKLQGLSVTCFVRFFY
jgi:hypothetical protein